MWLRDEVTDQKIGINSLVVNVLALYSDYASLNPAEVKNRDARGAITLM